jgi:hypothetical protein
MGCRDASMMPTAVFRLCGHVFGSPSGVPAQSNARINCASSLLPNNGGADSPARQIGISAAGRADPTLISSPSRARRP